MVPEIEGVSIVLLGSFNPRIFQPAWFSANGLLRESEASEARIDIVHPDVVSFATEVLAVQVTQDRFSASTTTSMFNDSVLDLVRNTFSLLHYTPVHAFGMNHERHFKMSTEEGWHSVGHRLAPKEPWADILSEPGLRSLTMKGQRTDGENGYIHIRVEPSVRILPFGIFIHLNDHHELSEPGTVDGAKALLDKLPAAWLGFLERTNVASRLLPE